MYICYTLAKSKVSLVFGANRWLIQALTTSPLYRYDEETEVQEFLQNFEGLGFWFYFL